MQDDVDIAGKGPEEEPPTPTRQHIGIEETVFILLAMLSLLGIFITDFSPEDGYDYWLFMVLVFSLPSIFVSWLLTKSSESDIGEIFNEQGLPWLHSLIIVLAASLLNKSGICISLAVVVIAITVFWGFWFRRQNTYDQN